MGIEGRCAASMRQGGLLAATGRLCPGRGFAFDDLRRLAGGEEQSGFAPLEPH